MRMGKKKQPTYRVVAADARSPRNGRFIEIVGTYEPRRDPSVITIDNDRAVHWLRRGAQPTERVKKLLKISGAWEDFTGEAAPAVVTAAADSADAGEEAEKAQAEPEVVDDAGASDDEADTAPYGEGSHAPLDDVDEAPAGFDIKGNAGSMLYHTPDSSFYGRTKAEVWFASTEAAEAAGFAAPGTEKDEADDADGEATT